MALPPGSYTFVCSRGPETIAETKTVTVGSEPLDVNYRVKRWIDPAKRGWWSGDQHLHAAGCLHYENPTQGVKPDDMIRHIMGEDLKVGCCLTWGPCFDYQKRFFTGQVAQQSRYPYTLRYDVEVVTFQVGEAVNGCCRRERVHLTADTEHIDTFGFCNFRPLGDEAPVFGEP